VDVGGAEGVRYGIMLGLTQLVEGRGEARGVGEQ